MGAGRSQRLVQLLARPKKLDKLAASVGQNARVGTPAEAARFGDVVLLSVPWWQVDDAIKAAGGLDGKIVIDTTNPYNRDWTPLALPEDTTAGQENAKRMPGARLVKAYNTLTAGFQASSANRTGETRVVMFYGGDNDAAKQTVAQLIDDSGFEPVDVGSSDELRFMELGGPFYGEEFHPEQAREMVAKMHADAYD